MILDEKAKSHAMLRATDQHHRRKEHLLNIEKHRHKGTAIDELIPILASASAPLRSACSDALGGFIAHLEAVNHSRWGKLKTPLDHSMVQRVRKELEAYGEGSHAILEPFKEAFNTDGTLSGEAGHFRYSARDLFTCYLFSTSLTYFATVLLQLLELAEHVVDADNKWNFPTSIGRAMKESAEDKSGGNPLDMARSEETLVNEQEHGKPIKKWGESELL